MVEVQITALLVDDRKSPYIRIWGCVHELLIIYSITEIGEVSTAWKLIEDCLIYILYRVVNGSPEQTSSGNAAQCHEPPKEHLGQKHAPKYRKEVAHIHRHDRQHAVNQISTRVRHMDRTVLHSQQIQYSSLNSEDACSW